MTETNIEKWFQELERIWLEKDVPALKNILSDEFRYFENPFELPITTWEELDRVWREVEGQNIQALEINVLISRGAEGCARYAFSYTDRKGTLHESCGVYYVKLDGLGKATEFRQWWIEK